MSDFTIHLLECLSNCPITEIFSMNIHKKKKISVASIQNYYYVIPKECMQQSNNLFKQNQPKK